MSLNYYLLAIQITIFHQMNLDKILLALHHLIRHEIMNKFKHSQAIKRGENIHPGL